MSTESSHTRTRILEAARAELEENQGKGVRMSDIARRASVSRQAVYLHFANRSDLLIATTRYVDEIKGVAQRMEPSKRATDGESRLLAFVEAWGSYIPEIYPIAKALMALQDTDEAARDAWDDRMQAVRTQCGLAIRDVARDGRLSPEYELEEATDILWTLLSVRNWEQLTLECGWSHARYLDEMRSLARRLFVTPRQE